MAMVSARRPLHSLSSSSSPSPSSLQSSPQADVERMLLRMGSERSTGSSRSSSLREINEEAQVVLDNGEGKIYVAVGKDVKDGNSNLLWAARNFPRDLKFVVLHVHQPADRIMSGFSKVPASQLEEKELKAYRKIEKEETNTLLNNYLNYCKKSLKVQADKLVTEKNNAANGIVELIEQHYITKLVMGTSSFSTRRRVPKSRVAVLVHQQGKPYCQIFFTCRETLACTREPSQESTKTDSPRSSYASSLSDQPEITERSLSLPPGHPGFIGSPDQQSLPPRSNSLSYPSSVSVGKNVEKVLPAGRPSMDMTPLSTSPNSSRHSTGGSSSSLKDLDTMFGSPVLASFSSPGEHRHSMVENGIGNDVLEQLHHAHEELERSRKEASEGRQKAERDLYDASVKFKARESSLRKEKKEVEERLTIEKACLEKEQLEICGKLQKADEQRAELENKLLQANSKLEELQQLQVKLQHEKDIAVREAEEVCKMYSNRSTGAVALTEFTHIELKEATNNFDESKKIGHGGCGSVYKGFLRHTTVAIKKFNREGIVGEREFKDEMETLTRMRHPNLVTLIGVCREAKALVYELLPNGSLEDRLQCKNQTEPLSWRMRIRIAADICSALIFLHSNKPKSIAHGDLKPDNVLLDAHFVSKLGDFGISRPLNQTNTTVTPYHRTNQIKGTFGYMDPGYIASGELTAQYDVYSFGVVLLRLLTGKNPLGLQNEVEEALSNGSLHEILDASAGEWPLEQAEELANLALRCCRFNRKERPDLQKETWGILQDMVNAPPPPSSSSLPNPHDICEPPSYFVCPITQEIMRDPHIAADGFTYEGKAIKDWLQRGHAISPMTYLNLTHYELVANNALRFAIQEWLMKQKQ